VRVRRRERRTAQSRGLRHRRTVPRTLSLPKGLNLKLTLQKTQH